MKTPKQKDSAAPAVTTGEDAIKWTKEKQKLQESYNVLAYVYGKEHLHEEAYFNNLNDLRLAALSAPAPLSSEAVGKVLTQLERYDYERCEAHRLGASDYTLRPVIETFTEGRFVKYSDLVKALALLTPSPSEKEKP